MRELLPGGATRTVNYTGRPVQVIFQQIVAVGSGFAMWLVVKPKMN